MSYQFSLQKILDLKEKEKEQLQSALSVSLKKLEEENRHNQFLKQQMNEIENQLIHTQQNKTSVSMLLSLHAYHQKLEKSVQQSQQRIVKAEKDVQRKTQQVIEKAKEEKTYQILKAREWEKYRYEQNRIEQNVLDEISTNLYIRSQFTMKES